MTVAEQNARRNDLVMHLIGMTDEALAAARVKTLAETWRVYWKVAARQLDIERKRRSEMDV